MRTLLDIANEGESQLRSTGVGTFELIPFSSNQNQNSSSSASAERPPVRITFEYPTIIDFWHYYCTRL